MVDQFEEDGNHYYIEELIETSLRSMCENHKDRVMPLKEALGVVSGLVQTLEGLHREHIIYLNFEPERCMVKEEQVWLSDFSASQYCEEDGLLGESGPLKYRPPEMFTS